MTDLITFTDDTFLQEVIECPLPVLVDFSASWCGPCRLIEPIIKELAQEYDGRIKVGKVDFDAAHETAVKYKIQGLPTILIFKDGKVSDCVVGAAGKNRLVDRIETILAE